MAYNLVYQSMLSSTEKKPLKPGIIIGIEVYI